ncbi:MAG: hypothetical protein ACXVY5_07250 [Gaiellales bacterium]
MRRAARSSLAAALAAVAAGCAGSGGSSGSLSHDQYIQRVNAICTATRAQIGALPQVTDLAGLARQGARAIALQQAEVRRIRALSPPQADQVQAQAMLEDVDRAVVRARELVIAARAGDQAGVRRASALMAVQLKLANDLARSLGLTGCVRTGGG